MLALYCDSGVTLRRDHQRPVRSPGEARISVEIAGLCDTDLQLARGYMRYCGVLGHEFVGRVTEADTPQLVGSRVVGDINAGCGHCAECTSTSGHHCSTRSVLGISGRDGSLCEELVLPERCLVAVPANVPSESAVFAEPLAAALHVLDEVRSPLQSPALVIGDGKLGLLIALGLRAAQHEVICVGHHQQKLEVAARLGVRTFLEEEFRLSGLRSDFVVDATGSTRGLELAVASAAPRATVVLKTTSADPTTLDLSPIVINELRVVGSRCGDLRRAIEWMANGTVDPRPLIAERFGLSHANLALSKASERGVLKVLVDVASVAASAATRSERPPS